MKVTKASNCDTYGVFHLEGECDYALFYKYPTNNCQMCILGKAADFFYEMKPTERLKAFEEIWRHGRMTVLIDLTKDDYKAVFPSLPKSVFILNQSYTNTTGNEMVIIILNIAEMMQYLKEVIAEDLRKLDLEKKRIQENKKVATNKVEAVSPKQPEDQRDNIARNSSNTATINRFEPMEVNMSAFERYIRELEMRNPGPPRRFNTSGSTVFRTRRRTL